MTMKNLLIIAVGIASTIGPITATAETYQWKDSSGRTVVSDTPPPGSARESTRVIGGKAPASSSPTTAKAAEAPKSFAEKDMDFKRRQQESSEKSEKEAKDKAAAADKRDNCDRAQKQVALLESGQRIAVADDKGERRIMEDTERQQEMERARRVVSESCK